MALTPNLTTVTVSGTYVDIQGNPIAGQVNFTPRAILTDASYNQIVIAKTISVTLDSNGSFSTILPATDDTSLSPYNFTYLVEEAFSGGRLYDIAIPSAAATLNLADVAPSSASAGLSSTYVLLSSYSTLNAQVTGMVATVNTASDPAGQINTATAAATSAASSASATAATAAENLRYIHPFLLMGV